MTLSGSDTLKKVKLYGALGKKYGREHFLAVKSPAEAVHALGMMNRGFFKDIRDGYWKVTTRKPGQRKHRPVASETVDMHVGNNTEIHITPVTAAAGIEVIIIGGLALLAVAASVFALTSLPPDADDPNDRRADENSFLFDGPVNVIEQGHPIPLVYGQMKTGSIVASAGLETTDFNSSGLPSTGGGTIGGGNTGGWDRDPYDFLPKGGKGGGSQERAPDDQSTLNSESIARILDVIMDGEWEPALPGLRWVEFDDVPVENEDGSYNHSGVDIAFLPGLPDQDYLTGFNSQESTVEVNTELTFQTGAIERSITDPDATRARVAIRLPSLNQRDPETGALKRVPTSGLDGIAPRVRIQVQANGVTGFQTQHDYTFQGLTTGPYTKDFNVNLPEGGAPWIIRVERMTADETDTLISNRTEWNTLTPIIDAKLRYPNTGAVGLTVSARQFGSRIPRRGYFIKGARIQVPSNYNPTTRQYTGQWDGTFQRVWSDNPAWVYYDLVTHKRYGLGKRLGADRIDKWSLYSIAQYCDGMVDDGFGGQEPRFTCNLVINKREKAYKVLGALASSFRAISYWAHDKIQLVQDSPRDPDIVVGPSNVMEGKFNYAGAVERAKKFSQFIIAWNDPDEGYRQNFEIVEDEELMRTMGPRPKEVAAYGCTSRGQANRLGRWLRDDQKYNGGLEYTAGPDHSFMPPGHVAEIHDPNYVGSRWTGRSPAGNTTTRIMLDDTLSLPGDVDYDVSIAMPDGDVEKRRVTNAGIDRSGPSPVNRETVAVTYLDLDSALPSAPVTMAVWGLQSSAVAARQFKFTNIKEAKSEEYKVVASLFDPNKFARVEQGLKLEPANFIGLPTGPITPPTNLTVLEYVDHTGDASAPAFALSWDPSSDARAFSYEAQMKKSDELTYVPIEGGDTFTRFVIGSEPGDYVFRVRSKDTLGTTGPWRVSETITLVAATETLPQPVNLRIFTDNAALQTEIRWDIPEDTRPFSYEVLFHATGDLENAVLKTTTDDLRFIISEAGTYWVRTVYLSTRSDNSSIAVAATSFPRPLPDSIDGLPELLLDFGDYDIGHFEEITGVTVDVGNITDITRRVGLDDIVSSITTVRNKEGEQTGNPEFENGWTGWLLDTRALTEAFPTEAEDGGVLNHPDGERAQLDTDYERRMAGNLASLLQRFTSD